MIKRLKEIAQINVYLPLFILLITSFAEIKWTKVSESKYKMYEELIDLFFDNSFLNFRAVVALNKSHLNYEKFHLTHDDRYQSCVFIVSSLFIQTGFTINKISKNNY